MLHLVRVETSGEGACLGFVEVDGAERVHAPRGDVAVQLEQQESSNDESRVRSAAAREPSDRKGGMSVCTSARRRAMLRKRKKGARSKGTRIQRDRGEVE